MAETQHNPAQTETIPRLDVRSESKITVVSFPRKQIDGVAVREMYELAARLMDQRYICMLIDLTDVIMVSSGVMGMLIVMKKKFMSVGGQLHVAAPDPKIRNQFEIMNLHLVLKIFESVDEARQKFKI